jgi:hypothetical protein
MEICPNGLFTLAKFVSETIGNSHMKLYLPWPPWLMQQEIETILSVLRLPMRPRQILFGATVAGIITHTSPMEILLKGTMWYRIGLEQSSIRKSYDQDYYDWVRLV